MWSTRSPRGPGAGPGGRGLVAGDEGVEALAVVDGRRRRGRGELSEDRGGHERGIASAHDHRAASGLGERGHDAEQRVAGLGRLGDDRGRPSGGSSVSGLATTIASRPASANAARGYEISGRPASSAVAFDPPSRVAGTAGEHGTERLGLSGRTPRSRTLGCVVADLISVAEAREAVLARVGEPLAAEPVPLDEALGRVLAADVGRAGGRSRLRQLGDGRLRGARRRHGGRRRRGAGQRCGSPRSHARERPPARALEPGEAFRISTGGVLPEGADAVVRVEDSAPSATGRSSSRSPSQPGATSGGPARTSAPATRSCRAGTLLGAGRARCARRRSAWPSPRAPGARGWRWSCTGDELLGAGEPMRPGGVRNSNAHTIPALARLAGAEVVTVERCPDEADATRDALERALGADVAVVCGGVSVGEHDHVKAALGSSAPSRRSGASRFGPAGRPGSAGRRARRRRLAGVRPARAIRSRRSSPSSCSCGPALRALTGADGRSTPSTAVARRGRSAPAERRDQAVRCALELTATGGWRRRPGRRAPTCSPRCSAPTRWRSSRPGREPARAGERVAGSSCLRGVASGLMRVRVRLFAVLRERAGSDSVEIELGRGRDGRGRDRRARRAGRRGASMPFRVAVNREYADDSDADRAGRRAGRDPAGLGRRRRRGWVVRARVSAEPLDLAAALALGRRPGRGRDRHLPGGDPRRRPPRVRGLCRDGGAADRGDPARLRRAPRAARRRGGAPRSARSRWASRAWSSPSPPRTAAEAFAGAREAIDRIKAEAPIWKKEIADGGEHWVEGAVP